MKSRKNTKQVYDILRKFKFSKLDNLYSYSKIMDSYDILKILNSNFECFFIRLVCRERRYGLDEILMSIDQFNKYAINARDNNILISNKDFEVMIPFYRKYYQILCDNEAIYILIDSDNCIAILNISYFEMLDLLETEVEIIYTLENSITPYLNHKISDVENINFKHKKSEISSHHFYFSKIVLRYSNGIVLTTSDLYNLNNLSYESINKDYSLFNYCVDIDDNDSQIRLYEYNNKSYMMLDNVVLIELNTGINQMKEEILEIARRINIDKECLQNYYDDYY